MERQRIVIGFDFGTTFSAVAWASSTEPSKVELIGGWPTAGAFVGLQTPTEIAYDEGNTSSYSWGYDIQPGKRRLKWFKLGLEGDDGELDLPRDLKVVDVVRDYLAALYAHSMEVLSRRFERGALEQSRIEFYLTVPAIWTDAAKSKTEAAARSAGFGNSLTIISEPEAAALYALKTAHNAYSQVRVKDRIVVCDAGGGTVDLISYDVKNITPLEVHESAPGTGGFCGSSFIDRKFMELFQARMGQHYHSLSKINRLQVAKNFETAKVAFRDDPGRSFFVNVPTIGTIEQAGVRGGNFEISREEMRSLFDPIVDQIIELVRYQVDTNTRGVERVNSILLVGGFGESEYLFQRLNGWASPRGIQVIQPRDCSTAIVRGAVMKGIEPKTSVNITRRARRSYGTPASHPFIAGLHREADAYIDPSSGTKFARDQITWFIRKNDPISEDQEIKCHFSRRFKKLIPWNDVLMVCSDDRPPGRVTSAVQKMCVLTTDLTDQKKRRFRRRWKFFRPYYIAEYDLVFGFSGGHLRFGSFFDSEKFSNVTAQFDG